MRLRIEWTQKLILIHYMTQGEKYLPLLSQTTDTHRQRIQIQEYYLHSPNPPTPLPPQHVDQKIHIVMHQRVHHLQKN